MIGDPYRVVPEPLGGLYDRAHVLGEAIAPAEGMEMPKVDVVIVATPSLTLMIAGVTATPYSVRSANWSFVVMALAVLQRSPSLDFRKTAKAITTN